LANPIGGKPFGQLISAGARVGISICDVTRPYPFKLVLPVLLDELKKASAGRVTLYVATGTHRACTQAELDEMLGSAILGRVRLVQHDAYDKGRHAELGLVPGSTVPALIEREFLQEEVRITTGFIEPHLFAGFSGGPKMVAPGLADINTVIELHSAARLADPRAAWGIIDGNPVHDPVREIAARARVTFSLDVTLNRERGITGVFGGDLFASHAAGCDFARRTAMVAVEKPFDVVITTNGGYPLDQNLYQSVKGMSAAAQIVREEGTIIIASECSDGFPEHGRYRQLLKDHAVPAEFMAKLADPTFASPDQWQVQIQAQVLKRARVLLKTDGLDQFQVRDAWLESIVDVSRAVEGITHYSGSIAVLPQGPFTIPYVAA
jgi:nickel-dependent lactate racemase